MSRSNISSMDKKYALFGMLFALTNNLQTTMDAIMPEITTKQWFILAGLSIFNEPPTLSQLAEVCGTSHQNTKQLVLKLEAKGFVKVQKDENDNRALRISADKKAFEWQTQIQEEENAFMERLFLGTTENGIKTTLEILMKIEENAKAIYNENRGNKNK